MFDDVNTDSLFGMSDALEALSELENNTSEAIVAQRSSERLEIQTKVIIRNGNASQRHVFAIEAVTADVSNGGCMVLMPRPIMAGDLFWMSFDDSQVRIGSLLARCMRCRMVREDAFEAGFRFMNDVDLSSAVVSQSLI